MILQSGYSIQTGTSFAGISGEFTSSPTPSGGRRNASSGRGWADNPVRDPLTNCSRSIFVEISLTEKTGFRAAAGRPSGRQPPSKTGNNAPLVKKSGAFP